jgi:hypothetical protein
MAGFLDTQALQVLNLAGGRVDDATAARPDQYVQLTNFLMTTGGKPYLRPASSYYDAVDSIPAGATRINALINYANSDTLIAGVGLELYRSAGGGTWTEIAGAAGDAFRGGTDPYLQHAEWNRHLFITNSEGTPPVKLYKNSGTWTLVTAGLPPVPETENFVDATVVTSAITLVNELRTDILAHLADTTQHTSADATSGAAIGTAATDKATLLRLTGELLTAYNNHFTNRQRVSSNHLQEELNTTLGDSTPAMETLASTSTPTTTIECVARLNDLRTKYNTHDGNADIHNDFVGLHQTTTTAITGVDAGPAVRTDLTPLYDLANRIKAQYNAHLASGGSAVTAHSTAADILNNATAANATTPATLASLVIDLTKWYSEHERDAALTAGWAFHVAKETDSYALVLSAAAPTYTSPPYPDLYFGAPDGQYEVLAERLNDLRDKISSHVRDLTAHYTTDPSTFIPFTIGGEDLEFGTYLYAFHFERAYTIDSVTYIDRGPVLLVEAGTLVKIEQSAATVTAIPVLANSASENYIVDTTLKIKIARTTDGGSTLYYCGEVSNGTTTFTDRMTDDELTTQEPLYTTGGVLDNDPPPHAKFLHVVNDFAYYGNQLDTAEVVPQRIRQSIQGDLDSCPADLYVDLPHDVEGLSSARGIPLGFTKFGIYRVEGTYNELGQGTVLAIPVTETVGLRGAYSPVVIDGGCVFFGTDAIYFTDGYNLQALNKQWRQSYQALIADSTKWKHIRGSYDSYMGRIWWSVSTGSGTANEVLVLDLNFGLKENAVFSNLSNTYDTTFGATSHCFFSDQFVRGTTSGVVLKHDTDEQTFQGNATDQNTNGATGYPAEMRGPLFDFGTTQLRKWVPRVGIQFQTWGSDVNAKIVTVDDRSFFHTLSQVDITGNADTSNPTLIEESRRMRTGGFRCFRKQVRLSNAEVTESTDSAGTTCTVTGSSVARSSGSFPALAVYSHYRIYFSSDNYKTGYPITAGSATGTLTITGAPGNAAGLSYVIEKPGVKRWQLDSYLLQYGYLGGSLQDASGEVTGNVP